MSIRTAMELRRSHYALGTDLPISEDQIVELVEHAVTHVPSAFNSQSARAMVLFGDAHDRLWSMTLASLRAVVPADALAPTEAKVGRFAAAAGTILFFEDQQVTADLAKAFPAFAQNFPRWSEQSSGMLQYAVWTHLAVHEVGASLQHYSALIEEAVQDAFGVPVTWSLISQMPFGSIAGMPKDKAFAPLEHRVKVVR